MINKIKEILEEYPTLSNREIGKLVGLSRGAIQYYLRKLNIHRDRKIQQKLNNTCREKILNITPKAEQVILGSILGDGYIEFNRHPVNTKLTLNSRLKITHGIKQKEYLEYKKNLLEQEAIKGYLKFIPESKLKVHYINNNVVISKGSYSFSTQRNVSFNFYRNLFYNPIKRINRYIYKLGPLGLAIWFMDDGFKNGRGFTLCADCFTLKEVQLLQKILKHNFNLDTTLQKYHKTCYRIYIRTSCRDRFISTIKPYMCKSMLYKIEASKARETGKI